MMPSGVPAFLPSQGGSDTSRINTTPSIELDDILGKRAAICGRRTRVYLSLQQRRHVSTCMKRRQIDYQSVFVAYPRSRIAYWFPRCRWCRGNIPCMETKLTRMRQLPSRCGVKICMNDEGHPVCLFHFTVWINTITALAHHHDMVPSPIHTCFPVLHGWFHWSACCRRCARYTSDKALSPYFALQGIMCDHPFLHHMPVGGWVSKALQAPLGHAKILLQHLHPYCFLPIRTCPGCAGQVPCTPVNM